MMDIQEPGRLTIKRFPGSFYIHPYIGIKNIIFLYTLSIQSDIQINTW